MPHGPSPPQLLRLWTTQSALRGDARPRLPPPPRPAMYPTHPRPKGRPPPYGFLENRPTDRPPPPHVTRAPEGSADLPGHGRRPPRREGRAVATPRTFCSPESGQAGDWETRLRSLSA